MSNAIANPLASIMASNADPGLLALLRQDAAGPMAGSEEVSSGAQRNKLAHYQGRWRIRREGAEEEIRGDEESVVIVGYHPSRRRAQVYYDQPYQKDQVAPVTCMSFDGEKPWTGIKTPQHTDCRSCPMQVYGSKTEERNGKVYKSSHCKPRRFLAVVRGEDIQQGDWTPLLLDLPYSSLKPYESYRKTLREHGIPINQVVTHLKLDPNAAGVIEFKMLGILGEEQRAKSKDLAEHPDVKRITGIEPDASWGGGLAIGRWEGVAVSGEPPRVVRLDLRGKGLTGAIPRGLGEMERLSTLILVDNALTGGIPRSIGRLPRLREVRLAGNALTGCAPSAFGDARGDAAYLGLPWCLRYALDATGEVAEVGEWAILGADGEVLATWEGLRSDAATLRVHQTDAGGTSWSSEFGAVSEGDLFEWRKASDCWVRYHVTGPPVRPSGGSGRWEFPVEWMTYAATGDGCTGAIGSGAVLDLDEEPLAVIRSLSIASPVRHGPFLLYPTWWTGVLEERVRHAAPAAGASGAVSAAATPSPYLFTTDVAEARDEIPHWREPTLPAGWTFGHAESGTHNSPFIGYCAMYLNEKGYAGGRICARYKSHRPQRQPAVEGSGKVAWEMHVMDGHAALARYSPQGPFHSPYVSVVVWVFDSETGIEYAVEGYSSILIGSDTAAAIAIARSLLPPAGAP